jgi:hypothetical protein
MAVISPTEGTAASDARTRVVSWIEMGQSDTATAVQLGAWSDRSVQVAGDFSGAASLAIHGSNDGTNYILLQDTLGDDLTFTAAGLLSIGQATRYIKPVLSSGNGSTDLDIVIHGVV